jgi:ornithine cyclodeaminase/alanine dehydrogenase-like protein (mu-crystallin family)
MPTSPRWRAAPTTPARAGRAFFVFSGHVLGDLAVAAALYRRAVERGIGTTLPR